MIDPQVSLTFALHSNPGAYAMLIGSGVSVGAGIPTGWQVVLDLISKLARVLDEDPGDDVAGWYQERFGQEPGTNWTLVLAHTRYNIVGPARAGQFGLSRVAS